VATTENQELNIVNAINAKTLRPKRAIALVNIGPGFGRIGSTGNYAFYPDYIKWFLSFAMLVGRLELSIVLILLTPHFWRR